MGAGQSGSSPEQLERCGPGGGGAISAEIQAGFCTSQRKPPSLARSAQGGGPPGQEESGSQLEARRLPRTRGEGQEGYCSYEPNLGCPKTPLLAPLPGVAACPCGRWKATVPARTPLTSFELSIALAHSPMADTAQEPPLPEQRPQRKAVGTFP